MTGSSCSSRRHSPLRATFCAAYCSHRDPTLTCALNLPFFLCSLQTLLNSGGPQLQESRWLSDPAPVGTTSLIGASTLPFAVILTSLTCRPPPATWFCSRSFWRDLSAHPSPSLMPWLVCAIYIELSTSTLPPSKPTLLTLFVRALPLTLRHTPNPAPPCTLAQLKRLVAALDTMGLGGLVLKALCLTGFYGFARLSSLVPPGLPFDSSRYPTLTDVQQAGKGLLLRIKFAKNAQDAAQWFAVPLLPLKCSPCCPVLALRRLCQLAQPAPPSTPLFRLPVRTATGELVLGGPLTAPVARCWFSVALREAGLAGANLTFHSLRRGACTLASQRGAKFHQLQASGNWHSDAVRSYFSPLPDRLGVAGLLASS